MFSVFPTYRHNQEIAILHVILEMGIKKNKTREQSKCLKSKIDFCGYFCSFDFFAAKISILALLFAM
jgi:hypothetical protein